MKILKLTLVSFIVFFFQYSFAQKSIKEYVEKNDSKKIDKAFMMDPYCQPTTSKGFKDGHGKGPYLTSKDQLPKKVALVTFNINDLGAASSTSGNGLTITTYTSLTENGGNVVASKMHDLTISNLKKKFEENGAVLLTPSEYLDTPEKKSFYYKTFMPEVSKLGKFLSNIETRGTDISVCADGYRYFDMGASFDFLRSQSMGFDLANELGVDAVLSIGVVIQSNGKEGYVRSMKMALNGPNPVPKMDKKYVAQKLGNGYYNGQIYVGAWLPFKKPIKSLVIRKKQITEMNFDGLEVLFEAFIDKFYSTMNAAIEKNSK